MKTLLMFGSATALALSAFAVQLTSSNVLGIQQVKQNKNEVVVPVTFAGVGTNGGQITLNETLYLDNLSMADTVMVMQNSPSGYYTQWIWLPGFYSSLYWTARRDADTEVKPSDQKLTRGLGIRVQVAKSSIPVYSLGEYTTAGLSTTFAKQSTTYMANPFSTDLDLDLKFVSNDISPMDELIVTDGINELSYKYSSAGNGEGRHWYRTAVTYVISGESVVSKPETYWDLKKIAPGEGFRFLRGWFLSDLTITW